MVRVSVSYMFVGQEGRPFATFDFGMNANAPIPAVGEIVFVQLPGSGIDETVTIVSRWFSYHRDVAGPTIILVHLSVQRV